MRMHRHAAALRRMATLFERMQGANERLARSQTARGRNLARAMRALMGQKFSSLAIDLAVRGRDGFAIEAAIDTREQVEYMRDERSRAMRSNGYAFTDGTVANFDRAIARLEDRREVLGRLSEEPLDG